MANFYVTSEAFAYILIRWVLKLGPLVRVHKTHTGTQNGARKLFFKILCEKFFSAPITSCTESGYLQLLILIAQLYPSLRVEIDSILTAVPDFRLDLTVILLHEQLHQLLFTHVTNCLHYINL